jgi:hypothetical protein
MPALERPSSTLSSSATIPVSPDLEPKLESTLSPTQPEGDMGVQKPAAGSPFAGKGSRFWLVFLSLCVSTFLSALDLTAVSSCLPTSTFCSLFNVPVPELILLPTVAAELHSDKYSWVGSAYALTSTALIPWTGGLAAIFGRRITMVGLSDADDPFLSLELTSALPLTSSARSSSSPLDPPLPVLPPA